MPREILMLDRLLDPVQVKLRKTGNASARFDRVERLIKIDHQRDIRADRLPDGADDCNIVHQIAVAYFDLDRTESTRDRCRDGRQIDLHIYEAKAVIGGQRAGLTAEQTDD